MTKAELAELLLTFNTPEVYNASQSSLSVEKTSKISIELTDDIAGVQDHDYKYDYSQLGETWSTPRVFRMPLRSDAEYFEDKYVAVMGINNFPINSVFKF